MGRGDEGKGSFGATQRVSEAQWICPMDESLWSVRCSTGSFYKNSSDTDSSRRFTVSNKTRERMRWGAHTAVMLVFPVDCIILVRVWYFISISTSQTYNMYATRCSRHNNKGKMTCWIVELKRGVSQAASLNQTSQSDITDIHFDAVYDTNTEGIFKM